MKCVTGHSIAYLMESGSKMKRIFKRKNDKSPPCNGPDFSSYSDEQLKIAKQSIDESVFPEDAKRLNQEINKRQNQIQPPEDSEPHQTSWQHFVSTVTKCCFNKNFRLGLIAILCAILTYDILQFSPNLQSKQLIEAKVTPQHYYCEARFKSIRANAFMQYDLILHHGDATYSAIMTNHETCTDLAQRLNLQADKSTTLLHQAMLIYQLGESGSVLSHSLQAPLNEERIKTEIVFRFIMLVVLIIGGIYIHRTTLVDNTTEQ